MGRIKGIDLSGYHRRNWYKQAVKNLLGLAVMFTLSLAVAGGLSYFAWQSDITLHQQATQLQKLQRQAESTDKQIAQLRQQQQSKQAPSYLQPTSVSQFIQQLSEISVHGALEMSQLYTDNGAKLKLLGTLTNAHQFEQLLAPLKQQKRSYKIEQFQTDEKNQLTFSLLIELAGEKNENVDHQ